MNKMTIIEIMALENGAHRNQTVFGEVSMPDGWAFVPDELARPESWPFVDLVVEGVTHYKTVSYLRDKTWIDEDGVEQHIVEDVTEEVPYTIPTVISMTAREKPVKPEPDAPETRASVWDELDAAYQEGVDSL